MVKKKRKDFQDQNAPIWPLTSLWPWFELSDVASTLAQFVISQRIFLAWMPSVKKKCHQNEFLNIVQIKPGWLLERQTPWWYIDIYLKDRCLGVTDQSDTICDNPKYVTSTCGKNEKFNSLWMTHVTLRNPTSYVIVGVMAYILYN